jgi:hypothetical protein
LGCHYKPYLLRLLPNLDHAPNSVLADVLGFFPANHRVTDMSLSQSVFDATPIEICMGPCSAGIAFSP